MNLDMALISRQFESIELPRDKAYLYKYFKTPVQLAFLKYFYIFRDYSNFTDHTGIHCTTLWLRKLANRVLFLEQIHRQTKQEFDLETLAKIEKGRYKPLP